ncbi:sn-1-specific diacylglycerol lipase ABHD11 isoform 2-T2 [Rhinophrynus dorsalis]
MPVSLSLLLSAWTQRSLAPRFLTRITPIIANRGSLHVSHQSHHGGVVALSYDLFEGSCPGPPLVLLHGLFGCKSNFQSIAKALVRKTGRKPQLVERLVSVDISPSPTVPQSGFPQFIAAMQSVHIKGKMPRSTARRLAEEQLSATVKEASIRQFLLTNLVQENDQFKWRVNLEAIARHLPDLMDFPEFHKPYPGPALFLGGADSPYISSENYPEIEQLFPCAEVEYILGAGHWVHSEKTQDFLSAICNFVQAA